MIVMLSARRLKPGSWEQFRRAWDPGDTKPPGFVRAYHARNIRDEDEVISFGLFEMSKDDYHAWRAGARAARPPRAHGRLLDTRGRADVRARPRGGADHRRPGHFRGGAPE